MRRWAGAVCVLGMAGLAWAAADGKALFAAKCGSCHGKDAKGNPAMARMFKVAPAVLDLSGRWTAEKEKSRAEALEQGRGKMPAFGKRMTPEERAAVIAFLKGGQEAAPTRTGAGPAPATATSAAKPAAPHLKGGLKASPTESERP